MRRRQQSFVTSVHAYNGGGGGGCIRGDGSRRCPSPAWTSSRSQEPFFSAWNVEAEVFLEERRICSVQPLFEFSLCATDFIPTLIVQLQNGPAH